MKTIKDVFDTYRQGLNKIYDLHELETITLLIINEVCRLSKSKIKAFPELELSENQGKKLQHTLTELTTGKPIQYILGKTEFYGLSFLVDPSVLIPRQETEELVKWIIDSVSGEQPGTGKILDVGTGSGCIAISLKKNLPNFSLTGIDISADALTTAKCNAKLNEVDIEFIRTDILTIDSKPDKYNVMIPGFEIIVSNPPYVTAADKIQMHDNVIGFEPHTALFVPQNDPLIFYKAITDFAKRNLTKNGLLFFEINENYGAGVVKLLADNCFRNIELRKDMNGRDRMVKASL